LSIFSHAALCFSYEALVYAEADSTGIGFSELNLVIENYSVGTGIYMIAINIAIFIILSLYLDQGPLIN